MLDTETYEKHGGLLPPPAQRYVTPQRSFQAFGGRKVEETEGQHCRSGNPESALSAKPARGDGERIFV